MSSQSAADHSIAGACTRWCGSFWRGIAPAPHWSPSCSWSPRGTRRASPKPPRSDFVAEPLVVRTLTSQDLAAVARVHLRAFPSSALTRLSGGAVRRYYEWQLSGPHEVTALGAFDRDALAGFCFGGVFRGALAGFLRKNRAFLVWRVATRPWLLGNAIVRDRAAVAFRSLSKRWRRPRRSARAAAEPSPPTFGVLSIAVDPPYQGHGVGRLLMGAAEAAARRSGFGMMRLTVDPSNVQGIGFYTSLQWQKLDTGARWNGTMQKTLIDNRAMSS
ncbi:MAG: GNAT family N-acetyltransferase [Luteitalea sp.]|nr:GNAT family N-acetyltransferase [Luteitalea sp.]